MQLELGIRESVTGARADVRISAAEGTTLAQLTPQLLGVVLPGTAGQSMSVDGVPVSPDALVGQPPLVHGALLDVDAAVAPPSPVVVAELHLVGGPAAGTVHRLAAGELVIGRTGDLVLDDPDVSRAHCRLRLTPDGAEVADLGSTNGTYVDGELIHGIARLTTTSLLRLGSSTLRLAPAQPPPPALPAMGDGRLAFNRPPRVLPSRTVVQVVVPAPPVEGARNPLPVLAMLAPLVLGVVMWRVLDNATFLLFTLLSPVLILGNVVTERRAGRRQTRRQRALWRASRDVAERTLYDAVREDEQLRRRGCPDPAAVLVAARNRAAPLWERRRDDGDALVLRLGLVDLPAQVEAEGDVPPGSTTARAVPATVSLREVGVLGLAGPRPALSALARWAVAQVAALHSPADLQLVIVASPACAHDWYWTRALPHLSPNDGLNYHAALGLSPEQVVARIAELHDLVGQRRSATPPHSAHRPVLLVVDGARALRAVPGVTAILEHGPTVGVHVLALEHETAHLPVECGAIAVLDGTAASTLELRVTGGELIRDVLADLVTTSYASVVARALAPLCDVSRDRGSAQSLPVAVRWTDVTGLSLDGSTSDVTAVVGRWQQRCSTRAVLGRGADGDFAVDLAADGPHALIAGTTGAGKSELLQTLIASLALGNRPDELNFVLVDYKGGAAFGPCSGLPHTVGMVTDLDGGLVERALISLTAELKRREGALARVGANDLADLRRRGGALPRLLIVVDEFASLAEELPDFVRGLVGIAQRGRSLGVHLVLATQRPEGVVSADIRANTNLRICLAVTRENESRDVIDSPAAASIHRATPGRAYARTGHADLTLFQSARVGGRRRSLAGESADPAVILLPAADLGEPAPARVPAGGADVTDLSLLVTACRQASDLLGISRPAPPWLPPLPSVVLLDDLPLAGPSQLLFGLRDLPASQSRAPLDLDLDRGTHLMIAGAPRSGRTTALLALAASITATFSADDLHLYALDLGAGLGPLAALPHAGAVVPREQPERMSRVLDHLVEEVGRRQGLLAAGGHAGLSEQRADHGQEALPHLLLMLDRWEGFLAAFQDVDAGRLVDQIYRLLREGPAVGLHVVVTADRTGLVGRISSMIEDRVLLRLADAGDYAAAGLPTRSLPTDLPAGRGWLLSAKPTAVQVALLDADASGPAQAAALRTRATKAQPARRCRPRRVEPLPLCVTLRELDRAGNVDPVIGVGGDELLPFVVDLSVGGFVIGGPPRSGRSTALLSLAHQLDLPIIAIAPRKSPLHELAGCITDLTATEQLTTLLDNGPIAVLVDDAELVVDSPLGPVLEHFTRTARDAGSVLLVAGTTDVLVSGYRGFVVDLRRSKCGLLLCPTSPADGDLLGVRLTRGSIGPLHPGRGVLVEQGSVTPLQVVQPK